MTRYITKAGQEKLQKELEDRKTNLRRQIAAMIKEAKEQGDLSENAEYTEAKRLQRENETRIIELENIIRTSKVAKKSGAKSVQIGSKVKVQTGKSKLDFEIVGANEVDPAKGKISNESPIGQEFLGRKKEEKFEIQLPNGKKVEYKILEIK